MRMFDADTKFWFFLLNLESAFLISWRAFQEWLQMNTFESEQLLPSDDWFMPFVTLKMWNARSEI